MEQNDTMDVYDYLPEGSEEGWVPEEDDEDYTVTNPETKLFSPITDDEELEMLTKMARDTELKTIDRLKALERVKEISNPEDRQKVFECNKEWLLVFREGNLPGNPNDPFITVEPPLLRDGAQYNGKY